MDVDERYEVEHGGTHENHRTSLNIDAFEAFSAMRTTSPHALSAAGGQEGWGSPPESRDALQEPEPESKESENTAPAARDSAPATGFKRLSHAFFISKGCKMTPIHRISIRFP